MKVLFIETSGRNGGAEKSLKELVSRLLLSSDLEIAVAAPETAELPVCRRYAIPEVRLHRPAPTRRFFRSLFALRKARRALASVLRDFAPDMIHANGIAAVFALPPTGGTPVFAHLRDRPRKFHSALATRKCAKLLAISEPLAKAYRKALPPAARGKIATLVNGLDLSRFQNPLGKDLAREWLGLPKDATVVGMVANFVPWKRHDILLGAALVMKARWPEKPVIWAIAGDDLFGEHRRHVEKLKETARAYGLENDIRWLGSRPPEILFPAFDLLFHPAADEPFGRVIVEAMACGVPVVAHRSGGPASIIDDGQTGFLVDSAAPGAFALKMAFALFHGEVTRTIAANARAKAFARYSIDRLAEEYLALLRQ